MPLQPIVVVILSPQHLPPPTRTQIVHSRARARCVVVSIELQLNYQYNTLILPFTRAFCSHFSHRMGLLVGVRLSERVLENWVSESNAYKSNVDLALIWQACFCKREAFRTSDTCVNMSWANLWLSKNPILDAQISQKPLVYAILQQIMHVNHVSHNFSKHHLLFDLRAFGERENTNTNFSAP